MSDARRCTTDVVLNGVDISVYVNNDLISLTYTDNEEDEADDLQIKVLDREGTWLKKWLNSIVSDAAAGGEIISVKPEDGSSMSKSGSGSSSGGTGQNAYKVTSSQGVTVRSSASTKGKKLGSLTYGTIVDVHKFSDGWASITFSGKSGWIKSKNLVKVGSSGGGTSNVTTYNRQTYSNGNTTSGGDWKIGDEVIANGIPQYDSWGIGKPGMSFTNYKGKVTLLNLKPGIPYPIHVDYLGWYAIDQVQKVGQELSQTSVEQPTSKGLKITASIICENWRDDDKTETLDCGEFELDSVIAEGPPQTVTIKATSLPYSCAIRQTAKSKSWENTSLSAIAKSIAGQNGMGLMFESHYDPKYTRVEQYRTSDISFLSKLCHDAGASLKVTNNSLVIFDQSEYENKKPIRTIKFGEEGGYTKYRLLTGTNSTYTSCRVSYTTTSGMVISAMEYAENYSESNGGKNQCLEVHQKVSSIAEAQALAHKMLRLHNKFEYEASFTFPGNPGFAAGCVVELEDFGAWDGKYIIKQAKHSITQSGYTTQLSLRKALGDNESIAGGSAASGDSDEEITKLAMQVIRGDWGNGQARYDKLTAAGHDYYKVQAKVNQILSG